MTDDTEQIRVGEEVESGEPVSLPVIDVLAGRGFITGKSGSGKSNSASVVAEQLLEAGYGLLIVDVDGEYYGLKEEYELLHAGADEECDIQVSPEHAEKLATLALEENVPIILDVSSYLDTEAADEMLLAVARQLFAKAKKQKKPFLVLVEECHEYIPEGGGMTETGKMLIKIGKRGRKHGLGIVGMSQRPADVKKDFITQCDWMVWHRLTWDNDTRVVGRILGTDYADRVEELGDGEAFLDADWNEEVLRVQFDRKRTFDAGATPGLEEFERPELQSVSEDLVADLEQVSAERERHESTIDALEAEIEEKEQRIEELEAELAEARDMSEMADKFAQALVENAESSPPENAPADPEVAEAEEFVADAARGGYPGDEPGPAERQAAGSEPAEAAAAPDREGQPAAEPPATELLSEDQRELHDYEREPGAEPADSAAESPEYSAAESAESSTAEPSEGGERDTASATEAVDADAREDGVTADSGDDDSSGADEEAPSKTDGDEESEPRSDTVADATNTSGFQPVETISSGAESAADADGTADDADGTADGVAAGEGEDDSPATDDGEPDRTTIQATGGWPQANDTERAAEPDPDLTPAPEAGAETPEELERRLSEEFGVTMETGSDLTGGSLGSSGNGESLTTAAATDGDAAAEPAEGDEPTDADSSDGSADSGEPEGQDDEPGSAENGDDDPKPESDDDPKPESDDDSELGSDDDSQVGADDDSECGSEDQPDEGVIDPTADRGARLTELVTQPELRDEEAVVRAFVHGIEALDDVTRGMLEHYQSGDDSPLSAHVAAGGSGERQYAYARNRTLRKAGLVEHVGAGRYRYRLPALVAEAFDARIDDETLENAVASIEASTGLE